MQKNKEPMTEEENKTEEAQEQAPNLQEENAALLEANITLKEQLLLMAADGENFRKRSAKLVEDAGKFAVNSFSKDLIDVLENLYLVTNNIPAESLESDEVLKSVHQGVEMTKDILINIFTKHGIKRIFPEVGDNFDHNFHEAVANVPQADFAENAIVNVMRAGYMLHDRLIKPAMVVVAKPA